MSVAEAVDAILCGESYAAELRTRNPETGAIYVEQTTVLPTLVEVYR